MIDFKGSQLEREIILWGVRWYVAYPISYRQLEEMMGERGVAVDHSTLNRWVIKYGIVNLSGTHTAWQSCGMDTPPATTKYKNHRFPVEIISHAVWLYFRFCLSFRDVEEILFERGVVVTYEAIRQWCRKFGQQFANQLRRRRPRPGDKWQMDEVFLMIKGERHYLWRAVDQDGNVLDILVLSARNTERVCNEERPDIRPSCPLLPNWEDVRDARPSTQVCDQAHARARGAAAAP